MEFIKSNFINTSTQLAVSAGGGGTGTAKNIFNRDLSFQYVSDGAGTDASTTSITVNFDATTAVGRIALMGMNLKAFTIFYNGATANTFSFTSTAATTTSDFSTNSESSMYFACTQVNCTSVTIDMKSTQVSNAEKALGFFCLSDSLLSFDRIPSAENYTPIIDTKDTTHRFSDGGVRVNVVQTKRSAEIAFEYITESFRNNLKTIYDTHSSFMFAAFPTSTSWDEFFFDCVWHGPFEFFRYSDNAVSAGHGGTIRLAETPS